MCIYIAACVNVVIKIYYLGWLLQIKFLWRWMVNPSAPLPTVFVYPLHLNKRDTDSRGSLPCLSLIISAAVQPGSAVWRPLWHRPLSLIEQIILLWICLSSH